jgi:hypothetical protein
MIHIDNDDGIRFFNTLGSQLVYKFVKSITVPYSRKAVNFGIRTDDEEIGIQQGCGKTRPYQRGGSGDIVNRRSYAVKKHENQRQDVLGLFKVLEKENNIVKDKQKGAVTEEYVYNQIQVSVDENIFRRRYVEMKWDEKVNRQNQGVEENNTPDNPDDFFCPAGEFEYRIIYKNRNIKQG